jgi:hypothetical protein
MCSAIFKKNIVYEKSIFFLLTVLLNPIIVFLTLVAKLQAIMKRKKNKDGRISRKFKLRYKILETDFDRLVLDFVVFVNLITGLNKQMMTFVGVGLVTISTFQRFYTENTFNVIADWMTRKLVLSKERTNGPNGVISSRIIIGILSYFLTLSLLILTYNSFVKENENICGICEMTRGIRKQDSSDVSYNTLNEEKEKPKDQFEEYLGLNLTDLNKTSTMKLLTDKLLREPVRTLGEVRTKKFLNFIEANFKEELTLFRTELLEKYIESQRSLISNSSNIKPHHPPGYIGETSKESILKGKRKRVKRSKDKAKRAKRPKRRNIIIIKKKKVDIKPTILDKRKWNISLEVKRIDTQIKDGRKNFKTLSNQPCPYGQIR